jgi:hypothetical protein
MKLATLTMILLCITCFTSGCVTKNHYRLNIATSQGTPIREVYIRNAGTTNWGSPIPAFRLASFDIEKYSRNVDIRVVDTAGGVHTRLNVNLDDSQFRIDSQTTDAPAAQVLVALVGLALILWLLASIETNPNY